MVCHRFDVVVVIFLGKTIINSHFLQPFRLEPSENPVLNLYPHGKCSAEPNFVSILALLPINNAEFLSPPWNLFSFIRNKFSPRVLRCLGKCSTPFVHLHRISNENINKFSAACSVPFSATAMFHSECRRTVAIYLRVSGINMQLVTNM